MSNNNHGSSLERFQAGMELLRQAKQTLANAPTFPGKRQVQQLLKQAKDAFAESQGYRAEEYEKRTGKTFQGKQSRSQWNLLDGMIDGL